MVGSGPKSQHIYQADRGSNVESGSSITWILSSRRANGQITKSLSLSLCMSNMVIAGLIYRNIFQADLIMTLRITGIPPFNASFNSTGKRYALKSDIVADAFAQKRRPLTFSYCLF
jgi:hypothetical protein